jgi:hypothetical protein
MSLDIPAGGYHGLRIELKATDKRPSVSENQKNKLNRLHKAGYCSVLAIGCESAVRLIESYLKLPVYDGEATIERPESDRYWINES